MKKRNLISIILALLLALQWITPALASEGDIPPELGEDVEAPEDIQPPEDVPGLDDIQDTPQPPEDTPLDESQPPEDITGPEEDIQEPEPEDEPLEDSEPDPVPLEDLINVLVPSSGQIVLNPYGLEVDMDGGVTTDQIVHSCQTLINLSDFPVIVDVSVTGTIPAESGAEFVSAPPAQDAPGKDVFLYAEFQPDPSVWVGEYWGLPYQILADASGENVLTLEAEGEGYFRIFGAMSVYPEEPWSDTDTFGAVLSFTFTPVDPNLEPVEEPEVPEEEIPEEPENPDIPEEEPPEDSETPDVPEEVPPEEDPPEEITPPDITEEDPAPPEEDPEMPDTSEPDTPEEPGPETPDEVEPPEGPEAPADPPEPPASPDNEAVNNADEITEDPAEAGSSVFLYSYCASSGRCFAKARSTRKDDSNASVHGRKKTGNRSLQQAQTHPAVISTSRTLEGRWTIQNWTAVRFSAPKENSNRLSSGNIHAITPSTKNSSSTSTAVAASTGPGDWMTAPMPYCPPSSSAMAAAPHRSQAGTAVFSSRRKVRKKRRQYPASSRRMPWTAASYRAAEAAPIVTTGRLQASQNRLRIMMSKILLHQRHRNASGSNRLPISEQGGDQLCQGVRQGGVALAGQVHEISGIELRPRLVGVQEVTARLLRHPLEVGGELPGLLHAAVAHGAHLVRHRGGEDAFPNDGRRNDEDVGLSAGAPALRGLGLLHQAAHPQADGEGVHAEALLAVVGAQHDDQQAHRLVALQTGPEVVQGVQPLVEGVGKHRGPSREALLEDLAVLPQGLLQQAGPPLVLIEPGQLRVGAVRRIRAVAVGVGIPQAYNVLLHPAALYFTISGRDAAAADWPTRRNFSSGRVGLICAAISGYSSAMTALQVERIRSPPLPDMTRPSSSTCL